MASVKTKGTSVPLHQSAGRGRRTQTIQGSKSLALRSRFVWIDCQVRGSSCLPRNSPTIGVFQTEAEFSTLRPDCRNASLVSNERACAGHFYVMRIGIHIWARSIHSVASCQSASPDKYAHTNDEKGVFEGVAVSCSRRWWRFIGRYVEEVHEEALCVIRQ